MNKSITQHDPYRKAFIARFIRQGYKTLLDLSAGTGKFAEYYSWLGLDVTVSEVDKEKLAALKELGFKGKLVDLEAKSLPYKDDEFDVVACTEVIEHIKNPAKAVKEMLRIAKHLVVLTTPVGNSYSSPDHINFWYTASELATKGLGEIPYPSHIETIITKEADLNNNQRSFVVAIFKDEGK